MTTERFSELLGDYPPGISCPECYNLNGNHFDEADCQAGEKHNQCIIHVNSDAFSFF